VWLNPTPAPSSPFAKASRWQRAMEAMIDDHERQQRLKSSDAGCEISERGTFCPSCTLQVIFPTLQLNCKLAFSAPLSVGEVEIGNLAATTLPTIYIWAISRGDKTGLKSKDRSKAHQNYCVPPTSALYRISKLISESFIHMVHASKNLPSIQ